MPRVLFCRMFSKKQGNFCKIFLYVWIFEKNLLADFSLTGVNLWKCTNVYNTAYIKVKDRNLAYPRCPMRYSVKSCQAARCPSDKQSFASMLRVSLNSSVRAVYLWKGARFMAFHVLCHCFQLALQIMISLFDKTSTAPCALKDEFTNSICLLHASILVFNTPWVFCKSTVKDLIT